MARDRDCLSDGELRVLVDDGATSPHLAWCPGCRERYERVRADAGASAAMLVALEPEQVDVDGAYRRLRARVDRPSTSFSFSEGDPMNRFSRARRGALAGGVMVAIMAVAMVFAPVSAIADTVLGQFRQVQVQQFQAITIPMDLVQGLGQQAQSIDPAIAAGMASQLQGLGNFSTTLNQNSATKADSLAQAKDEFPSRLFVPSNLGSFTGDPTNIYFTKDPGTASYALNLAKADDLLKNVGVGSDWHQNFTGDTATFQMDVNPVAAMEWEANGKHLVVGQTINPTLNIPQGVDMNTLSSELVNNFPLLPQDIKTQLQSVTDWEHTLIIPVPSTATSKQVAINSTGGVNNGLLITSDQGSGVLWLQDGVLHVVATDAQGVDVLAIAKSE